MVSYSGTPLARKLGLTAGMRVRLLDAPRDYWTMLGREPAAMDIEQLAAGGAQKADLTHLFATDRETLERSLARARAGMRQDGMVWASWPKRSSGVPSTIGRSEVMAAGKQAGLVDVKVCAVDETWSGLKFVIPLADRKRPGSSH